MNTTINQAAEQQRAFENYTKLTDEFAKGGTAKLGAIVGFRAYLKPGSDRAEQTVELLADDLLKEREVITRRAIVRTLSSGMPAFDRVRDLNKVTRERMRQAALAVKLESDYQGGPCAPVRARCNPSNGLLDAASRYDPDATAEVQRVRAQELWNVTVNDTGPTAISYEGMRLSEGTTSHRKPAYWVDRYTGDAPAFLATVEILRALLQPPRSGGLRGIDGSGIAVFGVDLTDADLEKADFSDSYIKGIANGADLTNANLSNANFSSTCIAANCGGRRFAERISRGDSSPPLGERPDHEQTGCPDTES